MENRKPRWPCKLPYKENTSNKENMGFKDFPITFVSLHPCSVLKKLIGMLFCNSASVLMKEF